MGRCAVPKGVRSGEAVDDEAREVAVAGGEGAGGRGRAGRRCQGDRVFGEAVGRGTAGAARWTGGRARAPGRARRPVAAGGGRRCRSGRRARAGGRRRRRRRCAIRYWRSSPAPPARSPELPRLYRKFSPSASRLRRRVKAGASRPGNGLDDPRRGGSVGSTRSGNEKRDLPGTPGRSGEPAMSNRTNRAPNDLSAFWMPFTANRQFKQAPRMFVAAKDMHYTTSDGRKVLDGTAGLWCCQCRPLPAEDHRGDPAAGGRARLRAGLPDGPSEGVRAGQPAGRHRAGGHGPCLLHQLRLGIGRDGAEDRDRLSARERARARAPG